jgi:anti-sigma-K factor RskA
MNSDADKRSDDSALAAEYVLGVLPNAERTAVQRRLASDTGLQREVAVWDQHLSPLSEEIEPVAPPQAIWNRIEQQLFPDSKKAAATWWNSLAFWRGFSIAASAALATLAGVLFITPAVQQGAGETLIAELSGETGAIKLAALYDAKTGALKLNRTAGTAAAGRVFELWLIEGGNNPVSLGVLPSDTRTAITIPDRLRQKLANATLAISDEPRGGSPTGQPTGAVLAAGKVIDI